MKTASPLLLLASRYLHLVTAADDASRLGKSLTGLPIYRTIGNTNAVQVSFDGQDLNLTLCKFWRVVSGRKLPFTNQSGSSATSVDYVMVVGSDCANCVNDIDPYVLPGPVSQATPPH